MYFIILSAGASALLVSSVITIVILLRNQFKQWINTPLQILSISDVLFSIFTSGVLLVNCIGKIPHTNFDKENTTYYSNGSMWNEDVKVQKIELEQDDADFSTIINENNFNIIPECNIINIIVKYGMLFLPFTNSFVSLLMFCIQCNLSVFSLKNRCSKFLQFQEKIYQTDDDMNESHPHDMEECEIPTINKTFKMQLDSILKLMNSEKFSVVKQKFVQAFKCNEIKNGKRVTSILLLSQWIIPILIIGILYLAQYKNNYINDMENIQCLTESNFFFDECYNNITPISTTHKDISNPYPTILYKDYINNEDLIKSSDSNDTEVNEIISKVQSIVNAALNQTENILLTEYKNRYSLTNLKNDISLQNSSILVQNNTSNYNSESMLFNYLIRNSSTTMPIEEDNLNKTIINTTEKLQAIIKNNQDVVNEAQYNASPILGDQMYAEILKHIDNIPMEYNVKSYYKNNSQHEEMLKLNILKDLQYNSIPDNQTLLSVIKVIIYKNDNISKMIQVYVANECYISIEFFKLHLLIFVFIIYFLPILFSSVLHQHGKLNCQVILEKLKVNNEMLLTNINFMNEITYVDPEKATTSKENYKYVQGDFEKPLNNRISLKKTEVTRTDYNSTSNNQHEQKEWYHIPLDREKLYLNVINQVKNTLKLFDVIKISLLYGILLWTPIFVELLLKVFMLFDIPEWLMNITYLSAIMFGILRNIFNLKMIKLQEINTNIIKTNTVHPIV